MRRVKVDDAHFPVSASLLIFFKKAENEKLSILVTQLEEGASRLRDALILFITARHDRSSNTSVSHES